MFILPFIRVGERALGLEQIWLFLERNGTHMIEIEPSVPEEAVSYAKDFAELNNLVLHGEPYCVGDIVFCGVNSKSKDLMDFYTWKETPAGTTPPREVWRAFLWVGNSDPWGVNRFMDSLKLSEGSHSVFSVLTDITRAENSTP